MTRRPRVVSLISSATETLCALGLEESLLAVSHECDWPPQIAAKPRATLSHIDSNRPSGEIDDDVRKRLQSGLPLYGVNESLVRELEPDLIITQAQCDICAVRYDDVVNLVAVSPQLAQTQILALHPASLDEILHDVIRVGESAGVASRGRELFDSLMERVEQVRRRLRTASETSLPRVICIEWVSPLMTAGNWTPELIQIAGGRSGLTVAGMHSQYVSWEEIAAYDPEVLLIAPCGFDLNRSLHEASVLKDLPGWDGIAAVGSERVFVLDGSALLNRSGPRIVDSLELVAHLLHPAHFPSPGGFLSHGRAWRQLRES